MGGASGAETGSPHTPVLYQQVLEALRPRPRGRYIDATVGAGGHAAGILEASAPDGQLLGIDLDPMALALAEERLARFGERVHLVRASFADLDRHAAALGWGQVDGVLFDLGLSSMQLEAAHRGFSFQREGPLDMRFDPRAEVTAADVVNRLSETELADLLWRYGEERQARRVARAILAARPIETTTQLAEVIARALGRSSSRTHPATRTFQALRIAVNRELEALEQGLEAVLRVLAPGGRLVVIAFHSLEDRLVKTFFRRESRDCLCPPEQPLCACGHLATLRVLTRRPVRPGAEEVARNPRARSARLRAAERLPLA